MFCYQTRTRLCALLSSVPNIFADLFVSDIHNFPLTGILPMTVPGVAARLAMGSANGAVKTLAGSRCKLIAA